MLLGIQRYKHQDNTVPTLLVTKNSRTFQAPRSIFPGPCRKPAMFNYSNKQQLRVWESAVCSASVVREGTPAVKALLAYLQPRKRT